MRVCACLIAAIALVCLAAPMRAQSQGPVTAADLARLDATADAIADQALRIEKSDPALSASVMKSLAPLREDVTYLKVKLRREGSVTRDEFTDVRDRLEMLRLKAMNDPSGKVRAAPVAGDAEPKAWTVPVSTEMEVRLQTLLNSGTAKAEDRFEATTVAAGSVVRGFVSSVRASGKIDRTGSLTLSFDEIVIGGVHQRLRAAVVQVLDAKQGEDLTRIGGGAAVGGVIGGLLGGARGALVGVRVGGDGTIAATDGGNVDLPMSTVLRIRLDQPLLVNR
jgi:hypothetical protein